MSGGGECDYSLLAAWNALPAAPILRPSPRVHAAEPSGSRVLIRGSHAQIWQPRPASNSRRGRATSRLSSAAQITVDDRPQLFAATAHRAWMITAANSNSSDRQWLATAVEQMFCMDGFGHTTSATSAQKGRVGSSPRAVRMVRASQQAN